MGLSIHMLRPLHDEEAHGVLLARLEPTIQLSVGNELPTRNRVQILVAGHPKRVQIDACPLLHTLVIPWAGLPEETRALMLGYPQIAVHNLHHNALPVAEHAIALLLAAAKRIVPMDRSLRSHNWNPRYERSPSVLLDGKRAVVLGYGAVGQSVARVARGLGLKVTAVQRHPRRSAGDPALQEIPVVPAGALPRLLPETHVLFCCLPLTEQTEGLIGARELSLLPRDAILVNVGRGAVVDESALYTALATRRLFAAGLDVWYTYPTTEESRSSTAPSSLPFHELDNVVMSPHRASATHETELLRAHHLADLLNAAARGGPMPNCVDLEFGY